MIMIVQKARLASQAFRKDCSFILHSLAVLKEVLICHEKLQKTLFEMALWAFIAVFRLCILLV